MKERYTPEQMQAKASVLDEFAYSADRAEQTDDRSHGDHFADAAAMLRQAAADAEALAVQAQEVARLTALVGRLEVIVGEFGMITHGFEVKEPSIPTVAQLQTELHDQRAETGRHFTALTAERAKVRALRETLQGIATADWRTFDVDDLPPSAQDFVDWAKSRARHALGLTDEAQS